MAIIVLVMLAQIGSPPGSVLEGSGTFEHCGIACLYGILKANGHSQSLEQIEARVRSLHPDAVMSELTLMQLRTTLESYGLRAASYRSNRNPEQIPAPSILYLRPEKVGDQRVGHVILLQSIADGKANICDFTAGIGRRSVTFEELHSFWDGELITVSQQTAGYSSPEIQSLALKIAAIMGAGLVAIRLHRWRNKSRTSPNQIAL